jgi:signal transduction histidine kinase
LDELELMVKGALQCVRETDLHENIEEVDLNSILFSVADHHNQTQVKVLLPKSIIPPVQGRPLALKRALTNLVENGVKYGHEVKVDFRASANQLLIRIADSGDGIAPKHLDSVFKPYFRLARDDQGHGLGLGITRNIVHSHGGELRLNNRKSGGLAAYLIFPLQV